MIAAGGDAVAWPEGAWQADPGALAQALEGVDQRPPTASLADWVAAVTQRLFERIASGVSSVFDVEQLDTVLSFAALALAALGVAALLFLVLRRLLQGRSAREVDRPPVVAADAPAPPAPVADVEELLSAGRARDALAALWWWIARRACGELADPSWTSGELTRRSGRQELRPLLADLDRLAYAPVRPDPASVRALLRRAEGELR